MPDELLALVEAVRAEGIAVPTASTLLFAAAAAEVDLARADSLYWAGRLTLVHRVEDVAAYDRAFLRLIAPADEVVGPDAPEPWASGAPEALAIPRGTDSPEGDEEGVGPEVEVEVAAAVASSVERLRHLDIARCTPGELSELSRAVDRLRWSGDRRPSRLRSRRGPGPGRLDLPRTAAAAVRTGGEVVERHHDHPSTRPRRVVLILDVSGSMAPYARVLLRFAHAAVVARGSVEVFTVGTRLTRLTRHLTSRDPDAALASATAAVEDWAGGTRLGAGLGEFVDRWGQPGAARGATAVILSDGWERDDPTALATEMARLARLARRVVWVNPLRATPGYEPLAAGMAAALPHCDDFVDGHSLASLEELAALLGPALHRPPPPNPVSLRAPARAGRAGSLDRA